MKNPIYSGIAATLIVILFQQLGKLAIFLWQRSRRIPIRKEDLDAEVLRKERSYLEAFEAEMILRNRKGVTYIPQRGVAAKDRFDISAKQNINAAMPIRDYIAQIRQYPNLLKGIFKGGTKESARSASVNTKLKKVRNIARLLEFTTVPIALLGEPGSGKSTTLREVARKIAHKSIKKKQGLIPIYIPLRRYQQVADLEDTNREIFELIQSSLPEGPHDIQAQLNRLVLSRRLVIFFDGMDEMDRVQYNEKVKRLSHFALTHKDQVRCIIACRINDLSPELNLKKIVLRAFDKSQIHSYIRHNFPSRLHVGDQNLRTREIYKSLINNRSLNDLAENPLTLFLLREFSMGNQRWPKGRAELFSYYIESHVDKGIGLAKIENLDRRSAEIVDFWAALAFKMLNDKGGTVIAFEEISRDWSYDEIFPVLMIGLHSGVLEIYRVLDEEKQRRPLQMNPPESPTFVPEDRFAFVNHRVQEYLVGRHLASSQSHALAWEKLIDSPRWQEALLNLLSITGAKNQALDILEWDYDQIIRHYESAAYRRRKYKQYIAQLEKQQAAVPKSAAVSAGNTVVSVHNDTEKALYNALGEKKDDLKEKLDNLRFEIPPALERTWSRRVYLGSQVYNEFDSSFQSSWRHKLSTALTYLAENARPTNSVRMFWAWKNVTDLVPYEALPFRTNILWLRRQAILALESMYVGRVRSDHILSRELSHDYSNGQLISSFPQYIKIARNRWVDALNIGWFIIMYLASNIILSAAAFLPFLIDKYMPKLNGTVFTFRPFVEFMPLVWFLILVLLTFIVITIKPELHKPKLLCVLSLCINALLFSYIFSKSIESVQLGGFTWFYQEGEPSIIVVFVAFAALTLCGVLSAAISFSFFVLANIPSCFSNPKELFKKRLANMFQNVLVKYEWKFIGVLFIVWTVVFLIILVLELSLVPYNYLWVFESTPIYVLFTDLFMQYYLFSYVFSPVLLTDILYLLLSAVLFKSLSEKNFLISVYVFVAISIFIFFVLVIMPPLEAWSESMKDSFLSRLIPIAILVFLVSSLLFAMGVLIRESHRGLSRSMLYLLHSLGYRFSFPLVSKPKSAREFKLKIQNGNPFLQNEILRRTAWASICETREDYLALLEACETSIKKEPAYSTYAQIRYELEESIVLDGF